MFAGEDGANLRNVAAGPAGVVALSQRGYDIGAPVTLLWGSADGLTWKRISPTGLPDRVFISGVWGAAGQYWLRGQLPESDDPGVLYRSSDGIAWRRSRDMSSEIQIVSIVDGCASSMARARDACPIFLTGTERINGVILRSTDSGASWTKARVDDATGWGSAQAAVPVSIWGIVATSDGLLAYGNGLAKATDEGGSEQARFWRSVDAGVSWSRVANAAPLGDLYVTDVAVADQLIVAVGDDVGRQRTAVALRSTDGGRTWAQSNMSGANGALYQVIAEGRGFVGLGFGPIQGDTFPDREFVRMSNDGMAWRTGGVGDLEGGTIDDAVRFGNLIVAVGRAWTTAAEGTVDAPFGPAAWTLNGSLE